MRSLYEAIALVVLVALIGFWEWRSALLMALSIPITLAMTFGLMHLLGIDLQQVSIASLIIALGLLVDDPVVAGDAIKRELDDGPAAASSPPGSGPTKLATAILFATITNIVAYLPFLMLTGDIGRLHLQPAGRAHLLAGRVAHRVDDVHPAARLLPAAPAEDAGADRSSERRTRGFAGAYYRVGRLGDRSPLDGARRRRSCCWSPALASRRRGCKMQFFPKDLSYLSYVDVWLPEDAPLAATNATARAGRARSSARWPRSTASEHPDEDGKPRDVLDVGHHVRRRRRPALLVLGGARAAAAQLRAAHHQGARQARHRAPGRRRCSARCPAESRARASTCASSRPASRSAFPVAIRISGDDIAELRRLAERGQGDLPRRADRRPRARRLGRRQLHGQARRSIPTAPTSPASRTSTSRCRRRRR